MLVVDFGSPATGDTVVSMVRTLTFSDPETAPTVSDFENKLLVKYGSASAAAFHSLYASQVYTDWEFDRKGELGCQTKICDSAYPVFRPDQLSIYQAKVQAGEDVVIESCISPSALDPGRVGVATVTIVDYQDEVLALVEAFQQLQAAAQKEYTKHAVPQPAPNF